MRKTLFLLLTCLFFLVAAAMGQTPDGETPAQESVCDGETGAAFGLCNAYCEAMDCHLDNPQASDNACTRVGNKFEQVTGRRPPCELSCPCFTASDLQQGNIVACGENFPGFPDLAGVIYDDGRSGCSGFLCFTAVGRSCALVQPSGNLVFQIDITAQEDSDCRTLILQNCANPNSVSTASPTSTVPFIGQ